MAGFWSIIIPEATTNLVTNPSIYDDTTGFTAVGGSIVRDTTQMKREISALKITPTAGVNDGCYYGTVSLTTSTSYTFSVDIKGTDGEPYTIYFGDTSAVEQGTSTDFTATGEWERQEVTWACDSTDSYRLYVTKNNDNNTDIFYIDGLQCEAKAYSTTYVDGNQDGCKWTGAEHASTSERDAQSRLGGRIYNLDTYGFYVDDMPGIGMPPILHQTQEQPMLPGSLLRGFKTKPRVFDLIANQIGDTHEDLHGKRKDLLNAIKPDLVLEPQPFILRYTGANSEKPIEIRVVYDSGYQFTKLDGFTERQLPLRFIAYDEPYFYEVGDVAATLTTNNSLTTNHIVGKIDGQYNNMNDGMSVSKVRSIVKNKVDGLIYAGGSFSKANGLTGDTVNNICSWDGSTWSALSSGVTGGQVLTMVVDAEGNVYAGGEFTAASGVSNTAYIAMWDGSSWNAVGTGMDARVRDLAIDSTTGNVIACGNFTDAGGTAASKIAEWDGSSWSQIDSQSFNNEILAVTVNQNGDIYVGGDFTSAGGAPANYLCYWDGSSWAAVGGVAPDGLVWELDFASNGDLYAGGGFGHIGTTVLTRIARFNGSIWFDLGDGCNGIVYTLKENKGEYYAGGYFTTAGDIDADRVAHWNGSTWAILDIEFPGDPTVNDFEFDGKDMYIGFDTAGTSYTSYSNSISNNGTRKAYPKIVISRSGGTTADIKFIKNETTGATLIFDYSLLDGETLTIDFAEGKRSITSSLFNSSFQSLRRSSDFGNFFLAPGTNLINVFVSESGSPTITAHAIWRNTHWSADGVAV